MDDLILGAGAVGRRVADRWRAAGRTVAVLTRSADRADELAAAGLVPVIGDVTRPETLSELPKAERIVWSIGLDRSAGTSPGAVYHDGLAAVLDRLAALSHRPKVWIHVSTTGVYGDTDGATVDETTPCHPTRDSGIANLAAEEWLAASHVGPVAVILRFAGLYGPGRVPSAERLDTNQPLAVPEASVLNLLHLDDAAAAIDQAATYASSLPISTPTRYVVSDGSPVLRREWYRAVARWRGLPEPTFTEEAMTNPAPTSRVRESKRVDPRRFVTEVGFTPQYPTYREGLASIFQDGATAP